jgi:hypothetical protein
MAVRTAIRAAARCALLVASVTVPATAARAQDPAQPKPDSKPTFEIYGFAQLDMGHDFMQVDPSWTDTLRVTKLPSFEKQFGENNSTFASVKQSRLGFSSSTPTALGDLKTKFEIDMFGVGGDAGQTTIRLRHAWGEVGAFGAGQTMSPFMDIDVFPNIFEYWGPTGMVFFRNVQFRWTPVRTDEQTFMIGIERPGASGDQGVYAGRIELSSIKPRFPVPDLSAAYKYSQKWGYVRVGGMLREIRWDDTLKSTTRDLSGSVNGWGLNFTSNLNAGKNDVLRLGFVYGHGIENYMNDSPVDVGIKNNLSNPVTPVVGEALPIVGITAFLDHTWNQKFTSAVGYSMQDISNSDAQAPDAFRRGRYAVGNVVYAPVANVLVAAELQWGRRENFSDGFHSDDTRVQFSFKYNFSAKLGGQ